MPRFGARNLLFEPTTRFSLNPALPQQYCCDRFLPHLPRHLRDGRFQQVASRADQLMYDFAELRILDLTFDCCYETF